MKYFGLRYAILALLLPAACGQPEMSGNAAIGEKTRPQRRPAPTPAKSIMRPSVQREAPAVANSVAKPSMIAIAFAYDRITLDDTGRAVLDKVLQDPVAIAARTIVVRGHTDASGSDRANLRISRQRAAAVRDYLVKARVGAPITVIAMGERRPVRPEATLDGMDDPAGRAANRRVEISFEDQVPARR